ncbi:hypothetical protein MBLNU230_g0138t1 [Neophaeotheca triangularis]
MATIIPVIDINQPDAATKLLAAASQHGFVYIENNEATGVPPGEISKMFYLSRDFFTAPEAIKEAVSISSSEAGKNVGYLKRGVEKLDSHNQPRADVKEAFNMGEPLNNTLQQPLPKPLAPHAETLLRFQNSCHELSQKLLKLFATALELPSNWFQLRHDRSQGPSGTVFRLLYYPQVGDAQQGVDIRAGAHSDYGSLTLLFQLPGQPGLEIRTPGGEWMAVAVDPLANGEEGSARPLPILVNIGDLLEDWTGGLLKSTVHRVVFPAAGEAGVDRYSMAYFCHPLDDAELVPVPSKIVEEHAKKSVAQPGRDGGKAITAKEHLMNRLAASYTVK